MKILVLIKQVPDSTTNIKIKADASDIDRTGVKMVVDPFCEFAIEQAVLLKEKRSDVESVTAMIMAPAKAPKPCGPRWPSGPTMASTSRMMPLTSSTNCSGPRSSLP